MNGYKILLVIECNHQMSIDSNIYYIYCRHSLARAIFMHKVWREIQYFYHGNVCTQYILLCDNIDSRNTFLIYQFWYSYCCSNCSLVYMYCTLCVIIFVLSFQLFFLLTMQKKNSLRPNKLADICIFIHIEFCERAVIAIVNILEAKRTICLVLFCYFADDWKMEIADERTKMSWPA